MRALLALALLLMPVAAQAAMPAVPAPSLASYQNARVVTQLDTTSNLIGLEFFIPAGLDRQTSSQSGLAALSAQSLLLSPVSTGAGSTTLPLRDAVAALGGSLSFTVDGRFVRYYLETLPQAFDPSVALLRGVLQHASIGTFTVSAARDELDRQIGENEKIPLQVGLEMLNASFFSGSNAGLPEYGLPATLANLSSADVNRFIAAYYHRDGAVLSQIGDFAPEQSAQARTLLDVLASGATQPVPVHAAVLHGTMRRLVAHRDIAVPWLVAQFPAPSIDSPDFGAMIVLTSFLQHTAEDVASNPMITTLPYAQRAVGTFYNFDQRPANVILYINGGFGDPTKPLATALSVVQVFSASRIVGSLASLKTMAAGSYLDGASTLEDRAWIAAVFASQGGSADYVSRALSAIAAVKPADLQRVARKYLGNPNVAVVLPREAQSPT